jgi:uncharacterized protein (DUF2235 family)
MKRIIVCLDGTWNDADRGGTPTNIVRIRDALRSKGEDGQVFQRIYYDEGVGTADPIDRFAGGFLGKGLGRNVRQAYKYLARHYEPGDEIHLIGFSRGAFTARSVAGYIAGCGLLMPDACTGENEDAAWRYYRTSGKDRAVGDEKRLRERCHERVSVKSVAVFDTVGTLGIPNMGLNWIGRSRFAFHDTRLGTTVENAFHAVALDEKRSAFKATMWEEPFNVAGKLPRIEQVWFPGVHSDIGGGYEDAGLGRITLDWMIRKLMELGVAFDTWQPADASGKDLEPGATIHESRTFPLYFPDRFRPHFRPLKGIAAADRSQRSRPQLLYQPIAEALHRSVLDRWAQDKGYRPPNLEYVMRVVEGGMLPVIDWNGSVMTPETVAATYPFVARTGPFAEYG